MIYTVTFNPAIDYVVHTDAMQVGMVNRSRTEEIYYGGKGINVSMVLKELGLESRALGFGGVGRPPAGGAVGDGGRPRMSGARIERGMVFCQMSSRTPPRSADVTIDA